MLGSYAASQAAEAGREKIAMTKDPVQHHRRSIRLKEYDYSLEGDYFVTICVNRRACIFGEVASYEMVLNPVGQMVARWWDELNRKFAFVQTDAFVVMPNHVHGIINIQPVGADLCVCPQEGAHAGAPLHEIVQWFKTMTTNEYLRRVKDDGWPPLTGRLWQRNYYEHIIRSEKSLEAICEYIGANPAQWVYDLENPLNFQTAQIV